MKLKIEIKNRWTGNVIFEFETENNTMRKTVEEAIKSKANLSEADLSKADLSEANLSEADLSEADLSEADLSEADLSEANLSKADLSEADLSVIKADFFYVLLHAKHEIEYLKKAIIEGKIDGSTYDGECACLSGTAFNAATKNNGPQEGERKNCRSAGRPAERFFLAIRPKDTPENNQASKIVLGWIEEFEVLLKK